MIPIRGLFFIGVNCLLILSQSGGIALSAPQKQDEERDGMMAVIENRDVKDPKVLEAMRAVPRHEFVPEEHREYAYHDGPLPIGHGQTISQPYIVAFMTEALHVTPQSKVLEIGTGSGYQAAVLAKLVDSVYSIEIVESLAAEAKQRLKEMGITNVHVKAGDGYQGWPEQAPFDRIIVTAAPPKIPEKLIEQLKEGGRMIAPVGEHSQELMIITKQNGKIQKERSLPVRFVPMVRGSE